MASTFEDFINAMNAQGAANLYGQPPRPQPVGEFPEADNGFLQNAVGFFQNPQMDHATPWQTPGMDTPDEAFSRLVRGNNKNNADAQAAEDRRSDAGYRQYSSDQQNAFKRLVAGNVAQNDAFSRFVRGNAENAAAESDRFKSSEYRRSQNGLSGPDYMFYGAGGMPAQRDAFSRFVEGNRQNNAADQASFQASQYQQGSDERNAFIRFVAGMAAQNNAQNSRNAQGAANLYGS